MWRNAFKHQHTGGSPVLLMKQPLHAYMLGFCVHWRLLNSMKALCCVCSKWCMRPTRGSWRRSSTCWTTWSRQSGRWALHHGLNRICMEDCIFTVILHVNLVMWSVRLHVNLLMWSVRLHVNLLMWSPVLQTLLSVPDVVQNCEELRKLVEYLGWRPCNTSDQTSSFVCELFIGNNKSSFNTTERLLLDKTG